MSDEQKDLKKNIEDAELGELSEEELEDVAGGAPCKAGCLPGCMPGGLKALAE